MNQRRTSTPVTNFGTHSSCIWILGHRYLYLSQADYQRLKPLSSIVAEEVIESNYESGSAMYALAAKVIFYQFICPENSIYHPVSEGGITRGRSGWIFLLEGMYSEALYKLE